MHPTVVSTKLNGTILLCPKRRVASANNAFGTAINIQNVTAQLEFIFDERWNTKEAIIMTLTQKAICLMGRRIIPKYRVEIVPKITVKMVSDVSQL
jgi:hypothetical protein